MKLATDEKIQDYRTRGWWGSDTLYDVFVRAASARPEQLAAIDPPDRADFFEGAPRRVTWQQLRQDTERMASALHARGLRSKDRVVMMLPNVVDVVSVYMACAKLGVIVSPLPVQYGPYEIGQTASAIDPKAMIVASRFKDRDLVCTARDALGDQVDLLALGLPSSVPGAFDLSRAVDAADGEVSDDGDPDGCFTIVWTSGTTGIPKGVPRSHNHWLAIAPATYEGMGLQPDDVLLNPFPMTNMAAIGGMLCSWLHTGGRLVLHHPFDLPIFLRQLVAEGVTASVAPPALLTMLLKQPAMLDTLDLTKLRVLGSGSAPLSEFMVSGWKERGVEIINLFGSNEGLSLVSGPKETTEPSKRAKWFPRFGHSGASFENTMHSRVQTKLVSPTTGEVVTAAGTDGELLVKGPAVFEGYWGKDGIDTKDVFDEDGYFRTGDLFRIAPEDDNYLIFVGRTKDIIIRGGVNISSSELDALLDGHPRLTEAAVFGVPDEIMGERIGVAVVTSDGAPVELDEIVAFLSQKGIARNKLPERIVRVDALPRNPMNKVLRWKLKDLTT